MKLNLDLPKDKINFIKYSFQSLHNEYLRKVILFMRMQNLMAVQKKQIHLHCGFYL